MSQPQEPHRPFFPFGNPFRMLSPKGSQLSPWLLSLLNTFEEALAARLQKLNPKDKGDVLSLTWMKLAMESLCETHTVIKTLITELELPVTEWDEKWIDVYLDITVKLLDICIAFSSELSRLNQGHLFLQCAMHKLESNTSDKLVRACSSLDSWRQHIGSKNPRLENCKSILESLVDSLTLPKVKNSAKGKVLMRAMYGVKDTGAGLVEDARCGVSSYGNPKMHPRSSGLFPALCMKVEEVRGYCMVVTTMTVKFRMELFQVDVFTW